MNYFTGSKKHSGFTLIELMLAVLIMGILGIGVSSSLVGITKSQKGAESNANATEFSKMIQKSFSGKNKQADAACTAVLNLTSAPEFNTANGKTNVRINIPSMQAMEAGNKITVGSQSFTVDKLYLSDNTELSSDAGSNSKMYLTSLFIETGSGALGFNNSKRRNLGTLSVTIKNGAMASCNSMSLSVGSEALCTSLKGMIWSPQLEKCVQYVAPIAGAEMSCPPGTWRRSDDLCVPVASDCGGGRVAKGFAKGLMTGCTTAAIGSSMGLTPVATGTTLPAALPTQAAAAAPTPPAPPTNPYTPPETTQAVTAPAAPATPPASCVNGTTLNESNYSACSDNGFPCDLTAVTSAGDNCVVQKNNNYATPNLAATPPSVAPPANNTCMCNNGRILDGEFCMYCINNASVGWGVRQYGYGVSQCNAGVLVPVSGAAMETSGSIMCNNTYGRASRSPGNRYTQIP